MGVGRASVVKAAGVMVVQGPAAEGDLILEHRTVTDFPLGQHMLAHHSPGFPLSGQEAQELQLPIVRIVIAGIFNVVPGAQRQPQQLVPNLFGFADGVPVAAQLQIPEILPVLIQEDFPIVEVLVCQLLAELRGGKGNLLMGLSALNHAVHTHGHIVGHGGGRQFSVGIRRLTADFKLRTGQRCQNAIAGAVAIVLCLYFKESLGGHLVTGNGLNPDSPSVGICTLFHLCIHTGAVEQQGNVFFSADEIIQYRIPQMVVLGGVAVEVFQLDFLNNAGFPVILALSAADPHTDFGRGIAAQHGALVHQHNLCTLTGSRNGRHHAGQAAADYAKITFYVLGFNHVFSSFSSDSRWESFRGILYHHYTMFSIDFL